MGEVAPQAIVMCAAAAADRPFKEDLAIMKLMMGMQVKELQCIFFAQRACSF